MNNRFSPYFAKHAKFHALLAPQSIAAANAAITFWNDNKIQLPEPILSTAYLVRGVRHQDAKDLEKAKADYETAHQLDPENSETIEYLCRIYSQIYSKDKARVRNLLKMPRMPSHVKTICRQVNDFLQEPGSPTPVISDYIYLALVENGKKTPNYQTLLDYINCVEAHVKALDPYLAHLKVKLLILTNYYTQEAAECVLKQIEGSIEIIVANHSGRWASYVSAVIELRNSIKEILTKRFPPKPKPPILSTVPAQSLQSPLLDESRDRKVKPPFTAAQLKKHEENHRHAQRKRLANIERKKEREQQQLEKKRLATLSTDTPLTEETKKTTTEEKKVVAAIDAKSREHNNTLRANILSSYESILKTLLEETATELLTDIRADDILDEILNEEVSALVTDLFPEALADAREQKKAAKQQKIKHVISATFHPNENAFLFGLAKELKLQSATLDIYGSLVPFCKLSLQDQKMQTLPDDIDLLLQFSSEPPPFTIVKLLEKQGLKITRAYSATEHYMQMQGTIKGVWHDITLVGPNYTLKDPFLLTNYCLRVHPNETFEFLDEKNLNKFCRSRQWPVCLPGDFNGKITCFFARAIKNAARAKAWGFDLNKKMKRIFMPDWAYRFFITLDEKTCLLEMNEIAKRKLMKHENAIPILTAFLSQHLDRRIASLSTNKTLLKIAAKKYKEAITAAVENIREHYSMSVPPLDFRVLLPTVLGNYFPDLFQLPVPLPPPVQQTNNNLQQNQNYNNHF